MNTLHQPVRFSLVDGVATVAFAFPGPPTNALTLPRLRLLVEACEQAASRPDVDVVILTADGPHGFCPGLAPETLEHLQCTDDRRAFTVTGQRLLSRLAALPAVTVALVAGACRGPGLELALACDYRFAVARADSWVGFGPNALPGWGGSARLARPLPGVVTAREAVQLKVFHDAFCARRARIETRQHLDRIQRDPRKPARRERWFGPTLAEKLARERARFARVSPVRGEEVIGDVPETVGVWGLTDDSAAVAVEVAARGGRAVVVPIEGDPASIDAAIRAGQSRGRWTPLEGEQARARVTLTGDARALRGLPWVVPGDAGTARTLPVPAPANRRTILGYYHTLGLDPVAPLAEARPAPRRLAAA